MPTVRDIMAPNPASVHPETQVEEVIELVGVVTRLDLLGALAA